MAQTRSGEDSEREEQEGPASGRVLRLHVGDQSLGEAHPDPEPAHVGTSVVALQAGEAVVLRAARGPVGRMADEEGPLPRLENVDSPDQAVEAAREERERIIGRSRQVLLAWRDNPAERLGPGSEADGPEVSCEEIQRTF